MADLSFIINKMAAGEIPTHREFTDLINQRTPETAAALAENHGEHIEDESTMVYNALKARNYYVDDDCADLRPLALALQRRNHC